MKKSIHFIFLILAYSTLCAQDEVWFLNDTDSFQVYNGRKMHFVDTAVLFEYIDFPATRWGHTGAYLLNDQSEIRLLTNGCEIYNDRNEIIANGDSINYPSIQWQIDCPGKFGYNTSNSHIILDHGDTSVLVHMAHEASTTNLLFSRILEDGQGGARVIEKNTMIIEDTLSLDGLHAVRHGNGADWWVVVSQRGPNKNGYYTILVTKDKIEVQPIQHIGPLLSMYGLGQTTFSPDGSRLVISNTYEDIDLFDFDRCTGQLSNPVHLTINDDNDTTFNIDNGAAFSGDGRFLYIAFAYDVYQYDLMASDVSASLVLLDTFTYYDEGFNYVGFGYMELGPDGRIYGTYIAGNKNLMHVIWNPEKQGKACDYRAYHIPYPDGRYTYLPHLASYRLGPKQGSPCDTLGMDPRPRAGFRYERLDSLQVDFRDYSWFDPAAWSWDFGDGTSLDTIGSPSHTYAQPGTYDVCLTVSNKYGTDTKCKTIYVNQLVSSWDAPIDIKAVWNIWPNPVDDILYFNIIERTFDQVQVIDLLGHTLVNVPVKGSMGEIDLRHLHSGVYFMSVLREGRVIGVKKVIKK
jgi:PKD repeat protein